MEGKLKLTAEAYDKEITLILSEDIDIHEFMDAVEVLALGLTFPQTVINNGFKEKVEEIEEE